MDTNSEMIGRLLMAFVAGSLIGAEREYRSKSAGLRTIALICTGSALFTIISVAVPTDPVRIAANIVMGIGFLGAGIIFRENNRVRGLTTAATVWATAALGMGIGIGYYLLSAVSLALILLILFLMVPLQKWIEREQQGRRYRLVFHQSRKELKMYEELFKKYHLEAKPIRHRRVGEYITGYWVAYGSKKNHNRFCSHILNDLEVEEFDF